VTAVRLGTAAACAGALLLLGACGGDEDDRETRAAGADLAVTVRPAGADGPVRRRRIRCERLGRAAAEPVCQRLAGLTRERLAPVPPGTACTQIYGGPATARVRGTLLGRRVEARFERSDGCQIHRWERNRALLGKAP
jgi:hypothetical protein